LLKLLHYCKIQNVHLTLSPNFCIILLTIIQFFIHFAISKCDDYASTNRLGDYRVSALQNELVLEKKIGYTGSRVLWYISTLISLPANQISRKIWRVWFTWVFKNKWDDAFSICKFQHVIHKKHDLDSLTSKICLLCIFVLWK